MNLPSANVLVQVIIIGFLTGGVYALMAAGLTLIFGVMRVINIAHGAFLILSAYLAYWLFTLYGLDPFLSIIIAVPLLFIIGVFLSATYTNGPFRASANLQFLPGVVFGSGNGHQQNVCGLCPAAEQSFAQSVSTSRTAFNARLLFGVHGSYQVAPGLNIGGYFNLDYNSSASGWKFSPNPLKGPPTLRGGEDLGYAFGVKIALQLR
jgi:hypothetical protein